MMRIGLTLVLLAGVGISLSVLGGSVVQRIVEQELRGSGDRAAAIDRLAIAVTINPYNPKPRLLLAQLQPPAQSLQTYRDLTQLQPVNPLPWSRLFGTKLELGEYDEEARHALAEATRLGPFEPHVLETLVDQGSRHWLTLDKSSRQQIVSAAVRALRHSAVFRRTETERILTQRGLLGLVCSAAQLAQHPACIKR